jgi:hypothetical protein
MKRIALLTVLVMMVAPAMFAASWTGWITDEHCGAKGNSAGHASCAMKCAKEHNASLVFYNNEDKKIYKLSDQKAAMDNIGHEVTVTGDEKDGVITVSKIEQTKSASK